jgi:hypothetical protein
MPMRRRCRCSGRPWRVVRTCHDHGVSCVHATTCQNAGTVSVHEIMGLKALARTSRPGCGCGFQSSRAASVAAPVFAAGALGPWYDVRDLQHALAWSLYSRTVNVGKMSDKGDITSCIDLLHEIITLRSDGIFRGEDCLPD